MPDINSDKFILIVEDSAIQAELLRRILTGQNYKTITAVNGRLGHELLKSSDNISLVISDISMPEMDGFELCRKIKDDKTLKTIPVILLTQLSDPKEIIKGLDVGADNYITKPYDVKHLLSSVEYLLINPITPECSENCIPLEIFFDGKKHLITSERQQILNLLLSTYENAVQQNRALADAQLGLKVLNEQLERKVSELETSNRELNDFAHIVSHDLKAPLRAIGSLSDILLTDYGQLLPDSAKELITLQSKRTARMYNLIEGLLKYAKLGHVKVEMIPEDINVIIRETIEFIDIPSDFKINIASNLPMVKCAKTMIGQVFLNIISNAVNHIGKPDGVIDINCEDDTIYWKFSITDNGPGIEEKFFDKIFQIFQTLKARDKHESTGVGLSIVKKIVNIHGGKVWVKSKIGEGTTFYFTLLK
jgi:signal transduction histidine kinase